ncbi:hypothetical protein DFH27DRAFT_605848 [Peziza echinospora]|nr:hypothetical protein DFH27DRAFT_605848 [Peziza echinospora]
MLYSFRYPVLFLSLTTSLVSALPSGDLAGDGPLDAQGPPPPPPSTPNPSFYNVLASGPPRNYCKSSSIRYDPAQFVCHDNEILCPILTGFNAGPSADSAPRPLQRCGATCYDPQASHCAEGGVVKGNPPMRSWEFGEDVAETPGSATADEAQEALGDAWIWVEGGEETPKSNKMKRDSIPTEQQPEETTSTEADLGDEIAAKNLLKRYAEAWQLAREPVVAGDQYLSPDPYGQSTKPKPSRKKKSGKPKGKKPTDNVGNESLTLSKSTQYGSGLSDSNANQHSHSDNSGRVADQKGGDDDDGEELRKEEDSYLGLEKRWNINQLQGGEPKVDVKQSWDPKTNVKSSSEKLTIHEAIVRTKENMIDELNAEGVGELDDKGNIILAGDNEEKEGAEESDDVVADGGDDVVEEENVEKEEWQWDDKLDFDEGDEEKQNLMKRDFEEALGRLERMFANII